MSGPLVALRARTPLGWLQLRHNKARLAAALAGVAFADILIFMQLGFLGALTAASIASNVDWNADIVLASSEMETLDIAGTLPRRRLYQALAVEGVAEASPVYVGSLSWSDPETGDEVQTRAFGIDPAFPAFLDRDIQDRQAGLALPDTALFDRLSRGNFERLVAEVDAGRPVVLEANGRRLTLTGLFGQGATFTADGTLVVSDQTFLRFFPKRAAGAPSLIFVKVASGADATRVAARLRAVLPAKDTAVRTRAETIAIEKAYQLGKRPVGFVFSFGVVIGVIVGLVIVYQVLSTDV
ncbi:MAG: lipid ABC transporter, partial [Geminicoccaceae bacterium]|nr:lipid ABC transporter [Geminicoccaceae bacterium]